MIDLPAVSEKDKKDIEFAVKNRLDMVFASFIRKKQDVLDVWAALGINAYNISVGYSHQHTNRILVIQNLSPS